MAASVQITSPDPDTGETRNISLVQTGSDTLSAVFKTTAAPGTFKKFDLSDVKADAGAGKISVTYGHFPFGVTATGTLVTNPPSVSVDAGLFGRHQFALQPDAHDKIIAFLRDAAFPPLT